MSKSLYDAMTNLDAALAEFRTALRFSFRTPLALARDAWANLIDPAARWARDTGDDD